LVEGIATGWGVLLLQTHHRKRMQTGMVGPTPKAYIADNLGTIGDVDTTGRWSSNQVYTIGAAL